MIKKFDHVVITTENPAACLAFYEKLGFETRDVGERYEMFAGDFKINVHVKGRELEPHAQNIQLGSADLCFEIKGNLSQFADSLRAQGVTIELGVVPRSGVKGRMRSIYLRDPDGNLLEFSSYQAL